MVRQTVLPFKLERTDETLTAHGGLALLAEFNHSLGLCALVDGTCRGRGVIGAMPPQSLWIG